MDINVALDGTKKRDLLFYAGDDLSIVLKVYAHDGDITPIAVTNVRFDAPAGNLPLGTPFTVPYNYIGRSPYRIVGDVDGIVTTLAYGVLETPGGWPSAYYWDYEYGSLPAYPFGVVGKADNITVLDAEQNFESPVSVEGALAELGEFKKSVGDISAEVDAAVQAAEDAEAAAAAAVAALDGTVKKVDQAASTGAGFVGTPSGTVQTDLDARALITSLDAGLSLPPQTGTTRLISTKPKNTFAIGVAESSSLSADYSYTRLNGQGAISTTAADNRAWLAAALGTNWVQVRLPFGVIIGDSIAEGHPGVHGRLHQSTIDPTFNDAILNVFGCPAYALGRRTGMFWYNSGIGGQTTAQVLARFERDGLGKTVAVGDGRPDTTLPGPPAWLWVNAGINDVSGLVSAAITKANLLKMAVLALQAGIPIGFNTVGPVNFHNATQRALQEDINRFILTVLPLYGCYTFDFHSWFVDPTDTTRPNPVLTADGTHPTPTGYESYVARLLSDGDLPIYCSGITVESFGDTYSSNYRAPVSIEFEDSAGLLGPSAMSGQFGFFAPSLRMMTSPLVKVYVRDAVDGLSGARHSGFSNIYAVIGYRSKKDEAVAAREIILGGRAIKTGGTWVLDSATKSRGVVSLAAVSATSFFITFDRVVNFPSVCQSSTNTAQPPLLYAAVPQGATGTTQVNIRMFDSATKANIDPTTVPDNTCFNFQATGAA